MGIARIAVVGAGWWACEFHIPHVLENPNAEFRDQINVILLATAYNPNNCSEFRLEVKLLKFLFYLFKKI